MLVLVLMLAAGLWASADELSEAARSPYRIKRFVDSHREFSWEPLWRALGLRKAFLPACEDRHCSAELIRVSRHQVIVRLNHSPSEFAVFLRFFRSNASFRFAGSFQPGVKYFRPEHRLLSLGGKPYLSVSEQAHAGSGLSVESRSWFDLTRGEFKPVLTYTARGHVSDCPRWFQRTIRGTPISFEGGTVERVRIRCETVYMTDTIRPVVLFTATAQGVYTRVGGGRFKFDSKLSPASEAEIKTMYENFDPGPSREDFLRYNREILDRVAAGPPSPAQQWLQRFRRGF